MHVVHIAGPGLLLGIAGLAEVNDELAAGDALPNARVVVTVGHEEGPVRQPGDEGRPVEVRSVGARHVGGADRLQELLPSFEKM